MSVFGEFRALVPELFEAFELPPITITRTTTVQTVDEQAAGIPGTPQTITLHGVGKIGKRTVQLVNGALSAQAGMISEQTTALSSVELIKGDKLSIGTRTYTVMEATEYNPDALTPLMFTAVVQ